MLAELVATIDADGIFLDTLHGGAAGLSTTAGRGPARRGVGERVGAEPRLTYTTTTCRGLKDS